MLWWCKHETVHTKTRASVLLSTLLVMVHFVMLEIGTHTKKIYYTE
jgi:hypothetical protein